MKADDADGVQRPGDVYNAQRKFDQAAAASAKATELSTSRSAAGGGRRRRRRAVQPGRHPLERAARSPRRRSSSKARSQPNPNHAEAHYQLGMALVNEGNLAGAATEFETYLKLAPSGPNAATAKIARRAAEEVTSDRDRFRRAPSPAGRRSRTHRARRRPGRARPRLHPPRRRLQDLPDRTRPRRRRRRARSTSARTRSRKRCRRWTARRDLPLRWHLIGHLQSNKARKAAQRFDVIHSIDSADLALRIDAAARRGQPDRSSCWSRSIWPASRPSTARPRSECRRSSTPRRCASARSRRV